MSKKTRTSPTTLEDWSLQDDAVDVSIFDDFKIYEMYCDESNGQEELEYIIERLREAYVLGGRVIKVELVKSQNHEEHLEKEKISYDFKYPNG